MAEIAADILLAMASLKTTIGFLPKPVDSLAKGSSKLIPLLDRANLALFTVGTSLTKELAGLRSSVEDLPGNLGQNILAATTQLTAGFGKVDKKLSMFIVQERLTGQSFQQHIVALRDLQLITGLETQEIGLLTEELFKTGQIYGVQTGRLVETIASLLPELQSVGLLGGNIPGLSNAIAEAVGEFGPGSEKMVSAFVREALRPSNVVQNSLLGILKQREALLTSDRQGKLLIEMIQTASLTGREQIKKLGGIGDSLFSLGILDDIFGVNLRTAIALDGQEGRDKRAASTLSLTEKMVDLTKNIGVIFESFLNPIFSAVNFIRSMVVKFPKFAENVLSTLTILFGVASTSLAVLFAIKGLQHLQVTMGLANITKGVAAGMLVGKILAGVLGGVGILALIFTGIGYLRSSSEKSAKATQDLAETERERLNQDNRRLGKIRDTSFRDSVGRLLSDNLTRLVQGIKNGKNPNDTLENQFSEMIRILSEMKNRMDNPDPNTQTRGLIRSGQ